MSYFYSTNGICYATEHFSTLTSVANSVVPTVASDKTKTCINCTYSNNSNSCCLNNTIYNTDNNKCGYCHPGTVYDNGTCKSDTIPSQFTPQVNSNAFTTTAKNNCRNNPTKNLKSTFCYSPCPSGSTPYSTGVLPPQNNCYTCTDPIYNSLVFNNGSAQCKSSTPDHTPTLLDPLPKVSKPI